MDKNIIKLTVKEMQNLYSEEIKRLNFNNLNKIGNRSNNNGALHKCNYMIYLLDSLNSNTVLTVEGCWGDMAIRDFCLCNSGSVVECIVKAILNHNANNEYCKAWLDSENDAKNGFMAWEIKASLDSHFKCTPAKNGKCTVLINRSGVSIIKASEVSNYTDNKGRLSASGVYGNRNNFMVDFLENALGISGGYEE